MVHKLTQPTCNPPRSSRTQLPQVPSKGQPTNFSPAPTIPRSQPPTIKPTPTLCFLFLLIQTTITTTTAATTTTTMFHYPYAANGDPDLDLLTAVCCSAGQPTGQPMNTPPPNHPPFLVNTPFPASSSLPSSNDYFMNRSSSSSTHSLAHHAAGIPDPAATQIPFFSSSPASSACDFLDFHHSEPVRRVYSTGDLQGMNYAQVSAENCTQEGAAAGRVGRYSAEERKERIERYRSKRNHRNFHKKITYACRKTLADSRPRVRGRFARNGEAETEIEGESSEASYECYSHSAGDNGGSYYNNFDSSASGGDWLKQMQAALASADVEEECCYDEEVWAGLDSVFSVNLLS